MYFLVTRFLSEQYLGNKILLGNVPEEPRRKWTISVDITQLRNGGQREVAGRGCAPSEP